ncbi:protein-L-isoaspartate O-methyltransferase family protein [Methylobacterium aerolatum]|uniref:Protein-L-isoaspartate O-methyltransferase n=1 Tax=Methylobacterium aerolatum TaxID=418708 RepID=A0ABU0I5Q6_9HYPH|nr:protein-L-isoaspartate O-methyltransferase [Methylobacterium aerolatum]MDQ0449947.1 protein-L-isoaspartate(D-aspartate) O-methyltransferase [Methylobacterium aerolatum]GJD37492.1 Protein-L-isoaspartate O-methyltransferase [Methylobacterium aerolatum]
MLDYAQARRLMVDCQLRTFDVNDNAVLDAFDTVKRETFVPKNQEPFAYIDQPLRLGAAEADIRVAPAPMVLGRMVQALKLEAGTAALDVAAGYGYSSAIMAELGATVTALEPIPEMAAAARERLSGIAEVVEGPLGDGLSGKGPFEAILINGRVERRPQALLDQLTDGGRLVCVFGPAKGAKVTLFVRAGDAFGSRPLFDASLPALAAFADEPTFAF